MVAQVIVDIGDQHVEDDAPIKSLGVRLSPGAMFRENIDDRGVAAALAVSRAHHRHGRQERNADCALAIEAP